MKLELAEGRITVPTELMETSFEIELAKAPEMIRSGTITSPSETCKGEHAGRLRVTLWDDDRQVRLTCSGDEMVLTRVANVARQ